MPQNEVTPLDIDPSSAPPKIAVRGFGSGDPIKLLKRLAKNRDGTSQEIEDLAWLGLLAPYGARTEDLAKWRRIAMDDWRLTEAGRRVLGAHLSQQKKYLLIVRQMSKMTYPCPLDAGVLNTKEHPLSQIIELMNNDGCIFGDLVKATIPETLERIHPALLKLHQQGLFSPPRSTRLAIQAANGVIEVLHKAGLVGFEGNVDKDLRKLYLNQDGNNRIMIAQILDQGRQVASRAANYGRLNAWLDWLQDPLQMPIFESLETDSDQWIPATAAARRRAEKVEQSSSQKTFIEYLEQKRGVPGFESTKKILQVMRRGNIAEANLLEGWSIDNLLAEAQRPALQELAMTQAFAGYDHYTQKGLHPGLRVDSKRHIQYAGSGKTDLAIDFENFTLVVESNLRASTLQGDSEPGITMRHLETEAKKRPEFPAYGFLVCGAQEKVAKATVGLSHSIAEGVALGSTIHKASIPVTDAQVVTLLEALQKRGNEANDLCEFLEYSIKAAATAEPKIWHKIISHSIEILSTPEAIDAKLPISDIIQKAAQKMGRPLNWPSGTLAPAEDLAPALGL